MDRTLVILEPLLMLASIIVLFGGAVLIDKIKNRGNK